MLLDIGLPGMSGYEVVRLLRADIRFAATRLIALTDWGTNEDRTSAQGAGFDDYLTRSLDLAMLEASIAKGRRP